jgi:hypothetical protein
VADREHPLPCPQISSRSELDSRQPAGLDGQGREIALLVNRENPRLMHHPIAEDHFRTPADDMGVGEDQAIRMPDRPSPGPTVTVPDLDQASANFLGKVLYLTI